jgi:hypothetical protein
MVQLIKSSQSLGTFREFISGSPTPLNSLKISLRGISCISHHMIKPILKAPNAPAFHNTVNPKWVITFQT